MAILHAFNLAKSQFISFDTVGGNMQLNHVIPHHRKDWMTDGPQKWHF